MPLPSPRGAHVFVSLQTGSYGKVIYLYVTVYEKMGPPAKKYDNDVFYIVGFFLVILIF